LSAEKKHGKIKADNEKVKQAEQRYKEVCIWKKIYMNWKKNQF
jgi:hypothetical protein